MGFIIFFLFCIVFINGINLTKNKNISSVPAAIATFLMLIQFLALMEDSSLTYYGLPPEEFTSNVAFAIGVLFYYLGYFIWCFLALLLTYIPLFINKNKNNIDSLKEEENKKLN